MWNKTPNWYIVSPVIAGATAAASLHTQEGIEDSLDDSCSLRPQTYCCFFISSKLSATAQTAAQLAAAPAYCAMTIASRTLHCIFEHDAQTQDLSLRSQLRFQILTLKLVWLNIECWLKICQNNISVHGHLQKSSCKTCQLALQICSLKHQGLQCRLGLSRARLPYNVLAESHQACTCSSIILNMVCHRVAAYMWLCLYGITWQLQCLLA